MFLATTLDALPGVVGLHEGHTPGNPPTARLPLINVQNRRAWFESDFAERVVAELRNVTILSEAAGDARLLVDAAFYNAPLLVPLAQHHPNSLLFVVFRRCEGFVRSATIVSGEDRQPAGWPSRSKPLSDREKFISLGRLKPEGGSDDAERWSGWSAIQRNIWLWHRVNAHLSQVAANHANCRSLLYEDLVEDPKKFWSNFLGDLGLDSKSNLARCVDRSATRLNHRPSYQIGPIDSWSESEVTFYERLARPLESKLYG